MSKRLRVILLLAFIALSVGMPVSLLAAERVDGDFSLEIMVNGEELSALETITVDPEEDLTIDIHIFDVTKDVTIESISLAITFNGQPVISMPKDPKDLGSIRVKAGKEYVESITINPKDAIGIGNMTLATGKYNGLITLNYSVEDQTEIFSQPKNIRIIGNPLTTVAGVVALVVTGSAIAAGTVLGTSMASPSLGAGALVSMQAQVVPLEGLKRFALGRLEPTARGSVVGAIVKAARKRIIKRICPICSSRIKHDYCYTCQKTAKKVEKEYTEKVKALALQGIQILASGEVKTLEALCSELGISDKLGTDVIATLKNAKLVKVKGIASKIMGKAVTAGISTGISIILWITIGGFAILNTYILITVLFLALLLPILITKFFQRRARRSLG